MTPSVVRVRPVSETRVEPMAFHLKQNDTCFIRAQLLDDDGPIDLTNRTVQFTLKRRADDEVVANLQPAGIPDAEDGRVEYQLLEGDLEETGTYLGEFKIIDDDEESERRAPGAGYVEIIVEATIAQDA